LNNSLNYNSEKITKSLKQLLQDNTTTPRHITTTPRYTTTL